MAREITLRKDAKKALEASHNTAEARDSSPKIKDRRQRKKKGGGDGTEADTSQAQVTLWSPWPHVLVPSQGRREEGRERATSC